ncbi:MAG: nucleotidyltransferase domain-containing protein [Bacteroidia bacterium]
MESVTYKPLNSSTHARAVYQALSYFDIFDYPLKAFEILNFCPQEINEEDLRSVLNLLIDNGKLNVKKEYYYLCGSSPSIIERRIEGEVYLESKMPRIRKYARLVNSFPFVRAVLISGSVSKGVLNRKGDVDYFIIAEKNRVWVCRTLLILFKKIFLLNSKKYFCVNYFIDTNNLNVPDKNLFVATEIKTLIPVFNNKIAIEFIEANKWTNKMFPNNKDVKDPFFQDEKNKPLLSRVIERLCSSTLGEKLDNYFFNKTLARWKQKFPHFDKNQFDLNMRSYKSVSKHHPQGNQAKVLNGLEQRMDKLDQAI